jgi:hypothetical protein
MRPELLKSDPRTRAFFTRLLADLPIPPIMLT